MGARVSQQIRKSALPLPDFPSDYWEHIATYLEEGLVIIDHQQNIVFFNAAAESLTSCSQTQVRGSPYDIIFSANPWIIELVLRACASRYSRTAGEGELRDRLQRVIPVRVTCAPILEKDDTLLGFVLVLHDLSYRKELAEEEQREDRLASLGVLAAGLAHEIKNPLAGIRGAAQLLQSRLQTDQSTVEYTTAMIRDIDRLSALLEQLLQLSVRPQFDLQLVNIHKTLTDVLLLEQEGAPKGVTVQTHFDPSLPTIFGDESRLAQVFRNLMKNSLQALNGRRGGLLKIATRMATDFHLLRSPEDRQPPPQPGTASASDSRPRQQDTERQTVQDKRDWGRFLCIDFTDNGPGIAPDHLPHLFTPFFTTKSKGTGLGLPISQQIIAEHGGTIRLESDPAQGTCLHVYLPVPPA